jgi:hypothetical protein
VFVVGGREVLLVLWMVIYNGQYNLRMLSNHDGIQSKGGIDSLHVPCGHGSCVVGEAEPDTIVICLIKEFDANTTRA